MLTGGCEFSVCLRITGSAFSLPVTVPGEGFTLTKGEPVIGGLHGEVRHHHCPHCLSWVFTRPPEGPMTFVNVRATMLDDPGWFVPFVESYTSDILPWRSEDHTSELQYLMRISYAGFRLTTQKKNKHIRDKSPS